MLIALSIALALTALVIVAYPVWRSRQSGATSTTAQEKLEELLAQRDAAFQAIRDLHFDRDVGKVSAEDFAVFESSLKRTAADALRNLDAFEAQVDEGLGQTQVTRAVASRPAAGAQRVCARCGRANDATDRFCTGCGASLPAPSSRPLQPILAVCPRCQRPLAEEDRFCAGCGEQLAGTPLKRGRTA